MSGTGGVIGDDSNKSLPLGGTLAGTQPNKTAELEKTKGIGEGFSKENTIAHEKGSPLELDNVSSAIKLPVPEKNLSDVTPEMQASFEASKGKIDAFSLDSILDQDGDGTSALDEIISEIAAGEPVEDVEARIAEEGLGGMSVDDLFIFEETASDVFARVSAIESAPPEVMDKVNGLMAEAAHALEMGNIEDVSAILSRVQSELRDTRIKFDQESLQSAKVARETKSQERVEKLLKAIEKMDEQKKSGLVGKIFGAIATALAMVVGTILIATGVLSKVGIVLMLASMALMATLTISQNTGNWMNKMFGEDKTAQLITGIMWSVLAIALSLGASFCNSGKAATDAATQATTFAAKAAIHAKMAGHLAKMGQAGAMATSASADIHSARVGYEGKQYQASATEDLAYITKMQQHMDDLLEAIENAIKEINDGQEIASSAMKEALESKFSVARNV